MKFVFLQTSLFRIARFDVIFKVNVDYETMMLFVFSKGTAIICCCHAFQRLDFFGVGDVNIDSHGNYECLCK